MGRDTGVPDARARIPVGPGHASLPLAMPAACYPVTDPPARPSKIRPPELREDVLSRARLLDWLHAKIHRRIVTVVAEAGYGKTTLLADFSRHTRLRTIWYRLDQEDGDVVTFVRYLHAACREVAPGFGDATAALLRDVGGLGSAPEALMDTLIRDLATLADMPSVLVLDDVHALDRVPEVQRALRDLVMRAPDRFTIVLSGRRRPPVPLARLRTLGEVADLTADDLRFDHAETETLFREAYRRPLDRDTLAALELRTEGWAASLHLVRAAIRDRSDAEVRQFIRGLTAARGPLHDYLAEEVVGDLDPALRSFLMRTALLVEVDGDAAMAAAQVDATTAEERSVAAERRGLLSRPTRRAGSGARRYHPLVQEFLIARLRGEVGTDGIRTIHRRIAAAAEATDWRRAAHHYAEAGSADDLHRVLVAATRLIMSTGDYAEAEGYIQRFPTSEDIPWFDIVLSRRALLTGHVEDGLALARRAVEAFVDDGPDRHLAVANLMSVELAYGDATEAHRLAADLRRMAPDEELEEIAVAMTAILDASQDGSVVATISALETLQSRHPEARVSRFRGVSFLNLAYVRFAHGDIQEALEAADDAIRALNADDAAERTNALLVRAAVLGHTGRWAEAREAVREAVLTSPDASRAETAVEVAEVVSGYGEADEAADLARTGLDVRPAPPAAAASAFALVAAHALARSGDYEAAAEVLRRVDSSRVMPHVAASSRFRALSAHLAVAAGAPDARQTALESAAFARSRGALLWATYCDLLAGLADGPGSASRAVTRVAGGDGGLLALTCDLLPPMLASLDREALTSVLSLERSHPEKWRAVLRGYLRRGPTASTLLAARSLERVGETTDVPLLRAVAKRLGARAQGADLGRDLARRLARPVYVEDQGRVEVRIGDQTVPGTLVRRKVLSLLCYLLSRPAHSATREQVLEALWPELDPELGSNSMNQTVYFLRRLFEPNYREDMSPGYVHSDTEMIWLDPALVGSRSTDCLALLKRTRMGDETAASLLADTYRGRFALDFAYEDWAAAYRDITHSQYLESAERFIAAKAARGDHWGAIELARAVVDVDPEAEAIELVLIRMYRATGAHAAAAEQYGRYAAAQHSELGVEVPPLESL